MLRSKISYFCNYLSLGVFTQQLGGYKIHTPNFSESNKKLKESDVKKKFFFLKSDLKKIYNFNKSIMQLFSADASVFKKKKLFFDPENMKKTPSKVAHNRPPNFFFSTANRHKTSPNHIFCSIEMSPCVTSI